MIKIGFVCCASVLNVNQVSQSLTYFNAQMYTVLFLRILYRWLEDDHIGPKNVSIIMYIMCTSWRLTAMNSFDVT